MNHQNKYTLSSRRRDHGGLFIVIPNRSNENAWLNMMRPLTMLLNRTSALQA